MHPIIYDVAVSADGFIAAPDGDFSRFPMEGPVVDDYLDRLKSYTTCLMGRATYEVGYAHGLAPGANPYPWMDSYVVSASLTLPADSAVTQITPGDAEAIRSVQRIATGPIYLCGGGKLAGWLLQEGLIDEIRLKRAPLFLGRGIPLFGDVANVPDLTPGTARLYPSGALYQVFHLT